MYSVIEGSTRWIYEVPEEYAIKCIEQYSTVTCLENERILKFSFVLPKCMRIGTGFVKKYGIVKVPMNVIGVVISIDAATSNPEVYFKYKHTILRHGLLKEVFVDPVYEPPVFSKVHYYSDSRIEKQKSEEDAPDWLKLIAEENSSNVAYFEF